VFSLDPPVAASVVAVVANTTIIIITVALTVDAPDTDNATVTNAATEPMARCSR
jgi:hypothetical protein